ncbi:MAG: FmdE family protein [Herbaspirillum sp.]
MTYPAFFDQVPSITLHDGLAQLLGACSDGVMTYHYVDAVRLAGHSCPTVAGAYLMTRRALQILYPDQMPQRGEVTVKFSSPVEQGVTGVMANVMRLITGATGADGFKGLGGLYSRRDLLDFDCPMEGEVTFTRTDTGASVQLGTDMSSVRGDPRMIPLLQKTLQGAASTEETVEFGRLWQERVKTILLEHADDPEVIQAQV